MARCPDQPDSRIPAAAFSLIELMVACAVVSVFMVVLMSIAGQSGRLWEMTGVQNQHRQRARAMLDFMAAELRQAVIPLDTSRPSLQLVVNPASISATCRNRDAIFFQAPAATDSAAGDLAEIGYFVRWNGTQPSLCRYFVNPGDTNYLIYSAPGAWLSDALLEQVTPADKSTHYRGLFLENVIGLWVDAKTKAGVAYSGDSRSANALPAWAELSLVLIDASTARRLTVADVAAIRSKYSTASGPAQFIQQLPAALRDRCTYVSTIVYFYNSR